MCKCTQWETPHYPKSYRSGDGGTLGARTGMLESRAFETTTLSSHSEQAQLHRSHKSQHRAQTGMSLLTFLPCCSPQYFNCSPRKLTDFGRSSNADYGVVGATNLLSVGCFSNNWVCDFVGHAEASSKAPGLTRKWV